MKAFELESNKILAKSHRFSHKAMAAEFEAFVFFDDANYSNQAALEAFSELDRLELELSRFVENSDIFRINNLGKDQSTKVGADTFECLQQCKKIFWETNGAFDITIGNLWNTFLNKDKSLRLPAQKEIESAKENTGMQFVELDETDHSVKLLRSPVTIDLGGFGKGYALDKMADIFREWEIDHVLLHGGRSSVLALDPPAGFAGWPVTLSNPFSKKVIKEFYLANRAVSGSGLQKGRHIIDPRTGQPVQPGKAAWAMAPNAALSDALSTAFLIMPEAEVKKYCREKSDVFVIQLGTD